MADRPNLHLNVNVMETLPRCGSNQIAGQGIAAVRIYTLWQRARLHYDAPLMSLRTYLFSKKIEHCGGVCACMEGGCLCEEEGRQIQVWSPEGRICLCCSL